MRIRNNRLRSDTWNCYSHNFYILFEVLHFQFATMFFLPANSLLFLHFCASPSLFSSDWLLLHSQRSEWLDSTHQEHSTTPISTAPSISTSYWVLHSIPLPPLHSTPLPPHPHLQIVIPLSSPFALLISHPISPHAMTSHPIPSHPKPHHTTPSDPTPSHT